MLKIINQWGCFPEYKEAMDRLDNRLWPEEFNRERLDSLRNSMGEFAWAQEMLNEPIPEHDMFNREDFEACKDINQLGQKIPFMKSAPDGMTTFGGADLAIAKTDIADFTVIITMQINKDGKLQIIDGIRTKVGPEEIADLFVNTHIRMRWVAFRLKITQHSHLLIMF